MEPQDNNRDMLTYNQAASLLGLSPNYVAHLVSASVFHPVKLPGKREKYLLKNEVEWYARRRSGETIPNPIVEISIANHDIKIRAESTMSIKGLQQAIQQGESEVVEESFAGIGMVLLLLGVLLIALIANKRPDPQKLEQLKSDPNLEPVRRALRKLALEVA